jgi:hypothetical protein
MTPARIKPLAYLVTLTMERKTIPTMRMMKPKIRRNIVSSDLECKSSWFIVADARPDVSHAVFEILLILTTSNVTSMNPGESLMRDPISLSARKNIQSAN